MHIAWNELICIVRSVRIKVLTILRNSCDLLNIPQKFTILQFQEIHRNCEQGLILIIYNTSESTHGKFKNTLIQLSRVIYAYGHGSFFGMAKENSIDCIEGYWSPLWSLGCLSFDQVEEAIKCVQAKTPLREWSWLGGVEMYIVPCCNPLKSLRSE